MRPERRPREEGAALVEFAIVLLVLSMLTLGTLDAGTAYYHKEQITHASREGARYGAALPTTGSGVTGATWAASVVQVTQARANGSLNSAPGVTICAALVQGANTVYDPSGNGTNPYSTAGSITCFNDGGADGALRVQVRAVRPATLNAVAFSTSLTLVSQAVARFEST
ncbi:MAG: TadE/TadG family type IV pilus assembly protein [Acidimicrobiales bacterium]